MLRNRQVAVGSTYRSAKSPLIESDSSVAAMHGQPHAGWVVHSRALAELISTFAVKVGEPCGNSRGRVACQRTGAMTGAGAVRRGNLARADLLARDRMMDFELVADAFP